MDAADDVKIPALSRSVMVKSGVRRFYGRIKGLLLRNNIRQIKDKTGLLYYHKRPSREELLSRLTDYSVSLVALYMVHGFHN